MQFYSGLLMYFCSGVDTLRMSVEISVTVYPCECFACIEEIDRTIWSQHSFHAHLSQCSMALDGLGIFYEMVAL